MALSLPQKKLEEELEQYEESKYRHFGWHLMIQKLFEIRLLSNNYEEHLEEPLTELDHEPQEQNSVYEIQEDKSEQALGEITPEDAQNSSQGPTAMSQVEQVYNSGNQLNSGTHIADADNTRGILATVPNIYPFDCLLKGTIAKYGFPRG